MPRRNDKAISRFAISKVDTDSLQRAAGFIQNLLDMRAIAKLRSTYVGGITRAVEHNEENRLYCTYNLDGTKTGRLSNSSYGDPMGVSFHTLPREDTHNIRNMFVAPKGWVMIAADYSQMELRILAENAKEEKMKKAFISGTDLHTFTASLLFKKDASKVTKKERQIAKSVSFLIVYGGGAYRLSAMVTIPLDEAQAIIDRYNEVFDGVPAYERHVHNYVRENGYAYSIFGRRRNLPDVYSKDPKVVKTALRQGLNFTIQSAASDVLVMAIKAIYLEIKKRGLHAKLFATVHDSIEILAPFEEVQEVCEIIHHQMVEYPMMKQEWGLDFDVPLLVDVEVGPSFGDVKDAEIVGGKLQNTEELIAYVREKQA